MTSPYSGGKAEEIPLASGSKEEVRGDSLGEGALVCDILYHFPPQSEESKDVSGFSEHLP